MKLAAIFKRTITSLLAITSVLWSSFAIHGQELQTAFEIPKIEVVPGLSQLHEVHSGSFSLPPIDLSVDIRLQALRSKNSLNMRIPVNKTVRNFRSPMLEKAPKKEKTLQFTTENNRFGRSQNAYNSFFRSQRHPLPRAIYGNPRL